MTLRVDYHVHPNFGRSALRAHRRARAWWRALAEAELDAIVIAEHSYKKPEKTFHLLQRARRAEHTEIFPGVEALTREGIDLVVYTEDAKDMYAPSKLLKPYALFYHEAVHEIQERGLSAYVTHPMRFGTSSVLPHKGIEFTRSMIEALGAVERYNAAYIDLACLMRFVPRPFAPVVRRFAHDRGHETPFQLYHDIPCTFWAGGSDAHHPSELGSHVAIPFSNRRRSRGEIWNAMHVMHHGSFVMREARRSPLVPCRQGLSVLREYLIKQRYRPMEIVL